MSTRTSESCLETSESELDPLTSPSFPAFLYCFRCFIYFADVYILPQALPLHMNHRCVYCGILHCVATTDAAIA